MSRLKLYSNNYTTTKYNMQEQTKINSKIKF